MSKYTFSRSSLVFFSLIFLFYFCFIFDLNFSFVRCEVATEAAGSEDSAAKDKDTKLAPITIKSKALKMLSVFFSRKRRIRMGALQNKLLDFQQKERFACNGGEGYTLLNLYELEVSQGGEKEDSLENLELVLKKAKDRFVELTDEHFSEVKLVRPFLKTVIKSWVESRKDYAHLLIGIEGSPLLEWAEENWGSEADQVQSSINSFEKLVMLTFHLFWFLEDLIETVYGNSSGSKPAVESGDDPDQEVKLDVVDDEELKRGL